MRHQPIPGRSSPAVHPTELHQRRRSSLDLIATHGNGGSPADGPDQPFRVALDWFKRRWPEARSQSGEAPVILFATGFRSGSTLVQRMLSRDCLMWGEPYGHGCLIDSVADAVRRIRKFWPEDGFFYRGQSPEQRASNFIANLYPSPQTLGSSAEFVGRKSWEMVFGNRLIHRSPCAPLVARIAGLSGRWPALTKASGRNGVDVSGSTAMHGAAEFVWHPLCPPTGRLQLARWS